MAIASDGHRLAIHAGGQTTVFANPARFRVVVAGRRWGKTQLARVELVSRALRRKGRYWYVAPTRVDAKDIFWADLKDCLDPSWLAKPASETELKVDLRNGSEIRLHGAEDPDSLRGRGLRFVVMDEFADMKLQAWTEAIRPALSDYRAPALFIGTPKSFNHFYEHYEKGQNPQKPAWQSWQFKTISNPFIDPQEVEDAKDDLDERTWRQEYEASFETVSGRAYYAFNRHHHTGRVAFDPQRPACLFFDFNIDPACGGIGQRDDAGRAVVVDVVKLTHRGGEATKSVAVALRDKLVKWGHVGEIRIYGDATGKSAKTTGPADHQVIRDVFPGALWCIPKANPHEKDRVSAVNSVCETMSGVRRLIIHETCLPLIADLEQVIYAENGELDKKTNPQLTHISDAFGYWIVRDFPPVNTSRAGVARVDWLL